MGGASWLGRPMRGWVAANLAVLALAGYHARHELGGYLGRAPTVSLGARDVGPWRLELATAGPAGDGRGTAFLLRRLDGPPFAHLRGTAIAACGDGARPRAAAAFSGSPNEFTASLELPAGSHGWALCVEVLDIGSRRFAAAWRLPPHDDARGRRRCICRAANAVLLICSNSKLSLPCHIQSKLQSFTIFLGNVLFGHAFSLSSWAAPLRVAGEQQRTNNNGCGTASSTT